MYREYSVELMVGAVQQQSCDWGLFCSLMFICGSALLRLVSRQHRERGAVYCPVYSCKPIIILFWTGIFRWRWRGCAVEPGPEPGARSFLFCKESQTMVGWNTAPDELVDPWKSGHRLVPSAGKLFQICSVLETIRTGKVKERLKVGSCQLKKRKYHRLI